MGQMLGCTEEAVVESADLEIADLRIISAKIAGLFRATVIG